MNLEIEKNNLNFYYLIGLICTDGNIRYPECDKTNRAYSVRIGLHNDDIDLLNKIKKLYGGSLYISKTHKYTVWQLNDKNLVNFLKEIGLTNRKTYNLDIEKWFDNLNISYKLSFLRGCWDGDGSINIYNRKTGATKSVTTHICSASIKFINLFKNHFKLGQIKIISKDKQNSYKKDIISTVDLYYYHLNGKNSLILKQIYENIDINSLFIKRKYENWLKILEYYNTHQDRFVTSKYYGASFCKSTKKWTCLIKNNYNNYNLSGFPTEKDAAIAYDICTIFFKKSECKINFPTLIDEYNQILTNELKGSSDFNILKQNIQSIIQKVSISSNKIKTKNINQKNYKGVQKHFTKFICYIHFKKKSIQVKPRFDTEIKAAIIRDTLYYNINKGEKLYNLNFIEKIEEYKQFDINTLINYFTPNKYKFIIENLDKTDQ
jgi:hypothetical protein